MGETYHSSGGTAQTGSYDRRDNFVQHTITIKAGEAVNFFDSSAGGGTHVLCLGHNETRDTTAAGPTELRGNGFTLNAGDPVTAVTFATAGTYNITCSVHPTMNLTVTVQ